jgi:effector-binding domain-containing protein
MSYEIRTKEVPRQPIATMRMHTSLSDIGVAMRTTLTALDTHVSPKQANAMPFAIYYNEPFRPGDIDVEMGIRVDSRAKVDAHDGVVHRELPAATIAYTVHVGPYSTIGSAYEALYDWLRRAGYHAAGAPCETYVVGPEEEKNPALYVTELEVPIA